MSDGSGDLICRCGNHYAGHAWKPGDTCPADRVFLADVPPRDGSTTLISAENARLRSLIEQFVSEVPHDRRDLNEVFDSELRDLVHDFTTAARAELGDQR